MILKELEYSVCVMSQPVQALQALYEVQLTCGPTVAIFASASLSFCKLEYSCTDSTITGQRISPVN